MRSELLKQRDWSLYGVARVDVARVVKSADDWNRLYVEPANPFAFEWGSCWNAAIEYEVKDFEPEVGFFVDGLGFQINALSPEFCMVMSPAKDCYISFGKGEANAQGFSLQFMLKELLATCRELTSRGITLVEPSAPEPNSSLGVAYLQTPAGIPIKLWGQLLS